MKILYIHTLYSPYIGGGAEITLQTLVEGMKKQGHEVVVLTIGFDKEIKVDYVNDIKVVRIPYKNIYWHYKIEQPSYLKPVWHLLDIYNISMANQVVKVVLDEKPDIISIHNLAGFSSAIWSVLKKTAIPMVQVLHDLYNICPKSTMFNNGHSCSKQCKSCKLYRLPHRNLSENVDAVVGISRFILEKHLSFGLFNNVEHKKVFYNTRSWQICIPRTSLRTNNQINIGYIGTIAPHKGIELLLDIFHQIDASNMKLIIAGKGQEEYENKLKVKYFNDKRIEFIGYSTQNDFYSKIDVLVVPSLWEEPLGMIVPEAFSFGIPVIGTISGGIPEMIRHDLNGFLFSKNEPFELLNLLQYIHKNPSILVQMSKNCIESAFTFFNVESWVQDYVMLYNTLLDKQDVS